MRVLLADDHEVMRQGLRQLLGADPEVQIVGEAENGRSAVDMAAELAPDVVVMDISMPDLNGIDATRLIRAGKQNGEGPKVIALSAHSDRRSCANMIKAGAMGYVLKKSSYGELLLAVRAVAANQIYLDSHLPRTARADLIGAEASASSSKELSSRERQIVQLIAEGKAMKEAAALLNVSIKTVEAHRQKAMRKLGVDSVAELTKYAIREGITSMDD